MSRRQMKVPITPVFKPLMGIFWDNNKKSYRTETHNCRIIISGAATGSKIAFILKFSLTVAFHLWGLTAILSQDPHDSCTHTEYWELRGEKTNKKQEGFYWAYSLLTLRSYTPSLCFPQNRELHFKATVQSTQSRIKLIKGKVLVGYIKTKQHLQPASSF